MNTNNVKKKAYNYSNKKRGKDLEVYRNLDVRGLRDLARGDVHYQSYVLKRYLESYDFEHITSENIPAIRLMFIRVCNMVFELCNSVSLYELAEEELKHTK